MRNQMRGRELILAFPMLMPIPLVPRSPSPRMRPPSVTTMICTLLDGQLLYTHTIAHSLVQAYRVTGFTGFGRYSIKSQSRGPTVTIQELDFKQLNRDQVL